MGGPILVALLAAALGTGTETGTGTGTAPPGLWLLEPPRNASAAPGAWVRFRCRVRGEGPPPELGWSRGGSPVPADTDLALVPLGEGAWIGASELRLGPLQGSHSGRYRCWARAGGQQLLSPEAHLELAGLPQFEEEPQDAEVPLGGALTLRCGARGPPEPVRLRWLQDGAPMEEPEGNGSATLRLGALSHSVTISCEARNARGVATSRGATIAVVPQPPHHVTLLGRGSDWLELGWELGEAGENPVGQCRVQAEASGRLQERAAPLPPPALRLAGLRPFTRYRMRVRCGGSPWSQWESGETMEGAPAAPAQNVTLERAGGRARARWAPPSGHLNGALRGFRLRYGGEREPEVELDVGLAQEQSLELQQNLWVRVAPYTGGGQGPWSAPVRLPPVGETALETQPVLPAVALPGAHWPPLVAAVAVVALVALVALGVLVARRWRRKKPHYGMAFAPHGEPVVQFRVRSSYSRRSTNALLSRLGISEELQEKLRDVTLDRHRLALGKTLGEGEFGSVVEGQLQQESGVLRVAVKTMKVPMGSRAQLEQFLSEAACMKEFDHPNVMSLIGVCLQPWGDGGLPAPIVVLPFMAHGDLHSFLLRARLGQPPLALGAGTLLRFLRDIAAGMEYLSLRNFIHRDLAARNCMLDERLRVLVADFGLAKRLGGGQYYRQGRVAPVPVKWVALESLESRVYSTKSDVWSFGVTMWEVLARGRTPYPGLENGDVYEYLRGGQRLRAPPGCPPELYSLMLRCWAADPRARPSFTELGGALGGALRALPPPPQGPAPDPLYVNMGEGPPAGGGGKEEEEEEEGEPPQPPPPPPLPAMGGEGAPAVTSFAPPHPLPHPPGTPPPHWAGPEVWGRGGGVKWGPPPSPPPAPLKLWHCLGPPPLHPHNGTPTPMGDPPIGWDPPNGTPTAAPNGTPPMGPPPIGWDPPQ